MSDKISKFPWSRSGSAVLQEFQVDLQKGLTEDQVRHSQREFGKNILRTERETSRLVLFFRQFKNPMVYTLLLATFVAIMLGEKLDSIAILTIVFLNAVIGYIQEAKASQAIAALKKLSVPNARVIRDGKVKVISSEDVVPGDIIQIEAGDYVIADSRVIEAFQLTADEALLTGESFPVKKQSSVLEHDVILAERRNMLHAGTAINNGSGRAVVTSIGMDTEIGRIASLLAETKIQQTPLQKRLAIVSNRLLLMGLVVIIAVIILYYLEGQPWFAIFMSAISLAVAAIPEGLPTVVTLALTLAVRRMTKRNAIVRNLASVETLGSTDIICTDKTGTLTTGIMQVREIFLLNQKDMNHLIEGIVLCNNASVDYGGSGDPTEKALLEYAVNQNYSISEIKERLTRSHEWSFQSERKRMSVAVVTPQGTRIITKGAPESMIDKCLLSSDEHAKIKREINRLTSVGHRLLAVAYKDSEIDENVDTVESELIFLGLVAMADPPKPETMKAIKECKDAGIKVVMITGDHPVTAYAIASELGIAIKGEFDEVMTGKEIEIVSDDELQRRVRKTAVYARVSPFDKLRIVEALQKNGHVVAMTGDGVNDAPALKKAQIGVAMGKAGTEVARQASSIVLTDDNFSTIVSAVEEGRAIYGNIKRTTQYLLSTNLAEILIVLGASVLSLPIPFTPIGLLWINLITDGMPSLALAAEPLDKNILRNSRRPSPSSFFDREFLTELFLVSLLMTLMCLGLYAYMLNDSKEHLAKSYTFSLLVYMTLFRSFSCRSENKSFFKLPLNLYHLLSVIIPIFFQFYLDQFETYQNLMGVKNLDLNENFLLLGLSLIPVTIVELIKLWRHH